MNMKQQENFSLKGLGRKVRNKYNKNRRYAKNVISESYTNIVNKVNAIKIKYL